MRERFGIAFASHNRMARDMLRAVLRIYFDIEAQADVAAETTHGTFTLRPALTAAGDHEKIEASLTGLAADMGGVRIAHHHGLLAHSDGDVLLHALSDALLVGSSGNSQGPTSTNTC